MADARTNFDNVAGFYDLLVKIFFGQAMVKAQTAFFPSIPKNASVLILGGGTGWIADKLLYSHPEITITYIDSSARMIDRARLKLARSKNSVYFILGTEVSIPPGELYDVVITNFFLDLFPDDELQRVITHVQQNLRTEGLWIVTDFVDEKWWNRCLLSLMYMFFNVTTGIKAKKLPTWGDRLAENGFKRLTEKRFYGRFISAVLFQNS